MALDVGEMGEQRAALFRAFTASATTVSHASPRARASSVIPWKVADCPTATPASTRCPEAVPTSAMLRPWTST